VSGFEVVDEDEPSVFIESRRTTGRTATFKRLLTWIWFHSSSQCILWVTIVLPSRTGTVSM